MPYSNFTLKRVQRDFQLQLIEALGICSDIDAVPISEYLAATLAENVPLAVAICT
jgi:hypothetical protein